MGTTEEDHGWKLKGACAQRYEEVKKINKQVGFDIFFPDPGKTTQGFRLTQQFCRKCPVNIRCFQEGLNEEGTWGGETPRKRRSLVKTLGTSLSTLQKRQKELWRDESEDHSEESNPDHESA